MAVMTVPSASAILKLYPPFDCAKFIYFLQLWNVDTGECLRVFNGHYHQVYTVAFDGERIVSGGLDTTVRIWSASTG